MFWDAWVAGGSWTSGGSWRTASIFLYCEEKVPMGRCHTAKCFPLHRLDQIMRFYLMPGMFLFIVSCGSGNDDFDPFDNDYGFHNNMKLADYDTIWDTCGYWGLESRQQDGLTTFYLFFEDDIEGKGFSVEMDRVRTEFCDSMFYRATRDQIMADLFVQNPVNLVPVKTRLRELGVADVRFVADSSIPFQVEIIDSNNQKFEARIEMNCDPGGYIVRSIMYINSKRSERTN